MFSLQLIQCRLEFLCLGLWKGGDGYDGDGFVGGVFVVITVVNMTVMMMIKFCYCVSVVPDKKLWPNVLWGQYYWERTTEGKISDQDDDEKYDFDDQRDDDCDDHHDKVLLDTDKILIGLIGYWQWWGWGFTWYCPNAASLQDPPFHPWGQYDLPTGC